MSVERQLIQRELTAKEMRRIASEITSSQARANPVACINALGPLLSTAKGRELLLNRERGNGLALIELFDWVAHSIPTLFLQRLKVSLPGFNVSQDRPE